MTLGRFVPRLGAFAALIAMTTGCGGLLDALDESREPDEPKTVGIESIGLGACIDQPDAETNIEDVTRVPCADPHDLEVFHTFDLTGDDFPSDTVIESAVLDECLNTAFESFVGIDYLESELEVNYITPVAQGWSRGDREVLCMLYDPDAKLTGSMKGANR